jgi:hypothetical protein
VLKFSFKLRTSKEEGNEEVNTGKIQQPLFFPIDLEMKT